MRGRAMEARHERQRQQEVRNREIVGYVQEQRTMVAQAKHHDKVAAQAQAREVQEREYEEAQIAAWRQHQELQELARRRVEEEQRLAAELEETNREQNRHQLEVQVLLERSGELRQLKEKLRTAEVNLERVQQKEQRAAIQQREREYNAALEALMVRQREEAAAREQQEAEQRRRMEAESKAALDQQMQERSDMQRVAQEEYEKERAMVDAVMRRIEEEERLAEESRRQRQHNTQTDIQRFLAQQQDLKKRQREAEAAEERTVQEYLRRRREREAQDAARQGSKREAQDRAYELLKQQHEEELARKEEEEALLDLLRAELEAERARRAADERKRRQEQMRQEMIEANDYQKRLKTERQAAERANEEEFRRRMLERFAEEDRIEQMNMQKRRVKQANHTREVERLLAYRRQLYQAMREAEEAEEQRQAGEAAWQAAIVQAERQRMLRDAAHLKDFLPKGVVRSMEDLSLMGAGNRAQASPHPTCIAQQALPAGYGGSGWQGGEPARSTSDATAGWASVGQPYGADMQAAGHYAQQFPQGQWPQGGGQVSQPGIAGASRQDSWQGGPSSAGSYQQYSRQPSDSIAPAGSQFGGPQGQVGNANGQPGNYGPRRTALW